MLAKIESENFFTGAFGKIYTRDLVANMEEMREQAGAKQINQTAFFDEQAEYGDTVIEVTLTLKIKSEDDEE
jgi:ethanolamine utilization protein EutQ (cupin superfamily)